MTKIKEIWKDVVGYEGLYQVSNFGRVKSVGFFVKGTLFKRDRILKPHKNSHGYLQVDLRVNCIRKRYSVHRLVGFSFIPNPDNKPFINHWDANPENNHVSNLEWCTRSENSKHPYLHLGRVNALKGRIGITCKVTKSIIIQYSHDNKKVAEFYGVMEASRKTGIDYSRICKASKGLAISAGGYMWGRRNII